MGEWAMCRTCLSKDVPMCSLFEARQFGPHFLTPSDVLTICTQLTINPKDMLPNKICKICLLQITQAYDFNMKSLEAEKMFLIQNALKDNLDILNLPSVLNDKNIIQKSNKAVKDETVVALPVHIVPKVNNKETNLKEVRILPKLNNDTKSTVLWLEPSNIISNSLIIPNAPLIANGYGIQTLNDNGKNTMNKVSGLFCKNCNKQFVSTECLQLHVQKEHSDSALIKVCSICNVSFDCAANLSRHNLEVHFPSKKVMRYTCEICRKVYKQKYLMERHKKRVHKSKAEEIDSNKCEVDQKEKCNNIPDAEKIFCNLCKREFNGVKHYQTHMRFHVNNVCKYCNTGFLNEEHLLNHVSDHILKSTPYNCVSCDRVFTLKKALRKHHRVYHRTVNESFFCGHCKVYNLITIDELQKHLQIHQNKPQVDGVISINDQQQNGIQISTIITLKNIVDTTSNFELLEALNESSKLFKFGSTNVDPTSRKDTSIAVKLSENKASEGETSTVQDNTYSILQKHIMNSMSANDRVKEAENEAKIIPNSKAQFECELCSKKFTRLTNLQKHMIVVHNNYPMKCVGCNFTSAKEAIFKQHVRQCRMLHTNRKLICPKCGKKLTSSTGYRYHIKTHLNNRRFICPECQRCFLTIGNLKAHTLRVHSKARPHCCQSCNRTFATLDHLNKHVAGVHSNRRNHTCKQCGKKFIQSSHLNHHMWTHTGVKPHSCPHCPNKYTAKCSLTKHLQRYHHPVSTEKTKVLPNQNEEIVLNPILEGASLELDLDNLNGDGIVIDETDDFDKMNVVFIVEENTTNV